MNSPFLCYKEIGDNMKFDDIKTPEQLLMYMNDNITYGFIGKNKKKYTNPESDSWNDWAEECLVQTGSEVLKTGIGTCWDQVELERLWFSSHNYEFKTIFMWFLIDSENNYPTHTFLLYKENDKWYWFENAFFDYQGIHEFDTYDDAIEFIKDRHLEYAILNKIAKEEDYRLIKCYEYEKLDKSMDVEEYINHVTKK